MKIKSMKRKDIRSLDALLNEILESAEPKEIVEKSNILLNRVREYRNRGYNVSMKYEREINIYLHTTGQNDKKTYY